MTARRPGFTILVHRDGRVDSRSYRIPLWVLRAATTAGATVLAVFTISLVLYGPIVRAAVRVPFLTREIRRLNAENEQVRQLAGRLVEMEARYAQVRTMLGGDIIPVGPTGAETLPLAHPVLASVPGHRPAEPGPSKFIASPQGV